MGCFSGVKTAQNSKTEGGIEHDNVKLKEDYVPGTTLPRECSVKQLQRSLDRSCS